MTDKPTCQQQTRKMLIIANIHVDYERGQGGALGVVDLGQLRTRSNHTRVPYARDAPQMTTQMRSVACVEPRAVHNLVRWFAGERNAHAPTIRTIARCAWKVRRSSKADDLVTLDILHRMESGWPTQHIIWRVLPETLVFNVRFW